LFSAEGAERSTYWLICIRMPSGVRTGSTAKFTRLCISDKEVVVMYKGESDPMVATGDGVKEPQNRCVEIVLE
jgi:hypothetical protein